jgi:mannitol-1-phosphate/altronate dehydrogenase
MSISTRRPRTGSLSLCEATLRVHASHVRVPTYDRSALTPGIVHLGVGAFHRAHQAVYLDDLAERGVNTWGVVGVALRRRATKEALEPQDGLFTVVARGPRGDDARVIGSLLRVLFAPEEPEAVLDALADPRTRVVTLTVTEEGYDVRPDLTRPHRQRTPLGLLAAALDRRRRLGRGPFTVVSCDNVPRNGATTRAALLAFAEASNPDLADWIAREVAFPSSMVDRITPATTAEAVADVAHRFGIDDRWPVMTEPFSQWVVEDDFCNGRPPLVEVGVQFVRDVEPHERLKKRLLNGGQSALGYVGYLLGHRDTASAMRDGLVRRYVDTLMRHEVAPLLPAVQGIDPDAYRNELLARLANPHVRDQLARLCRRGSAKMPAHLLPSILEARRAGRPHELLTLAVAAWVRYLRGVDLDGFEIPIVDAQLGRLQPLAVRGGADPAPLMAGSSIFGVLADDPMLVGSVGRALEAVDRDGLRPTLERYVLACTEMAAA